MSSSSAPSDSPSEPHQHPPRRRLVKASSLNLKRDREAAPPLATTPKAAAAAAAAARINKGEDHGTPSPTSVKHGRPPLNPAPQDARPLGRQGARPASNVAGKQLGEELRIQQAKRTAQIRAQSVGATGSFKSFDSPFGNYLLPVIPVQFTSKPVTPQPQPNK